MNTLRLGFKPCTAGCGSLVHYKSKACRSCGAIQARGENIEPEKAEIEKITVEPEKLQVPAAVAQLPGTALLGPHIALNDFRTQLGDVSVGIKAGRVVTDQVLIRKLLENGAPIVPATDVHHLACCPSCGKVFAPKPIRDTGAKGAA